MNARPPRLAVWLLQRCLDEEAYEAIAGDLQEDYSRTAQTHGRARAARRFWRTAAVSVVECRITARRTVNRRLADYDQTAHASLHDVLRPALRQFRDQPLYAITCAGTLALAVGAACVSLAVAKRALLDALPYRNDEELVSLLTTIDGATSPVSAHVLEDLRRSSPPFAGVTSIRPAAVAYSAGTSTESIQSNLVTPDYFDVLGVAPVVGRGFAAEERDAVVVSWKFWMDKLHGAADVIGKPLSLDGRVHRVVGVMPRDFIALYWWSNELWLPLDTTPLLRDVRTRRTLSVIARRAPHTSREELDAYLALFSKTLQERFPQEHGNQSLVANPLRDELVGPARPALVATGAAALLLLLIVGANIGGLSTAHAVATRHQRAVRAALGASGRRLFVEQLTETTVLTLTGTVAGIWLAYVLTATLVTYQPQFLPRLQPIALDATTVFLGVLAGVLTGVTAAMLPRRVLNASTPVEALRTTRGGSSDARVTLARSGLVVVQVAIAVVLLVGAGLLVRTVRHLTTLDLGFDPAGLTIVSVNLSGQQYQAMRSHLQFESAAIERIAQIRGVEHANASVGIPIYGGMMAGLRMRGDGPHDPRHEIAYFSVDPSYMQNLGARLLAGRHLSPSDIREGPRVLVINETMARRFFPAGDALGAEVQVGAGAADEPWLTVVGIVADLRMHGVISAIRPAAFGSTRQYSWPRRHITVRTRGARPVTLASDLRSAIHAVDPSVAVGAVQPIEQMLDEQTARHRLVMLALTLFGTVAIVLCISGLYAVVALTSKLRRREYAIRIALGARPGGVRFMVLRQGLVLAVSGLILGLAVAGIGTRSVQGLLHGVTPLDPATFVAAGVTLMLLAMLASLQPARMAQRVDPVETLKAE